MTDITNFDLVFTFLGIIIGMIGTYSIFYFRSYLSYPEKIANIQYFFSDEYLNRKFPVPLKIDDTVVSNLKEARSFAKKKIVPNGTEINEEALNQFISATLRSEWENKFAYELSLSIQRVGVMVLAGAISLEFVLAVNGRQIVNDWLICSELVKKKIRVPTITKNGDGDVDFQRRHGEWLAYASAIWLINNWEGKEIDLIRKRLGGLEVIKKREEDLRNAEKDMIHRTTKRSIKRLLK
ncbi:hypothetical protein [Methanolacinia paynteri]|uniref:hypothetical protein n=1 Tax=Methanolacinia paynteri TaxID=230356 RepID=UPI00064F8BD5|nr:hypothetical protein [Methanolacinia paynteri]